MSSQDPPIHVPDSTQIVANAPWSEAQGGEGKRAAHLVVVWNGEEPSRIGESAALTRDCTLGRGVGDGRSPRLEFVRQRPGALEPTGGLGNPTISRTQLRFTLLPDGSVAVENVGRCTLFHNGVSAVRAQLSPGDTLMLEDSIVFLVEERKLRWTPWADGFDDGFEFGRADGNGLVGENEAVWVLREQLVAAAKGDAHVLIHGASGTGKELAGRAIHSLSRRDQGPLVCRNAATFPEALIDAELFGNVKNYPNPGMPERRGLIGGAHTGTLILDEIGELPAAQQAHLLRVLDSGGEYQALGEGRTRRSDLRVVALTNRLLSELKPDFLARFGVRIAVAELSERLGDIPLLIRHIWGTLVREQPELSSRYPSVRGAEEPWEPMTEPRLIEVLMRHAYTHNTRELERLVRLAVTTSSGGYVGATAPLRAELQFPEPARDPGELDRDRIVQALEEAQGSPTMAARQLGLKNRHVLYRLMKKYGIGSEQ